MSMIADMTPELKLLAERYGSPLYTTALLATDAFEPVSMTDRVGEVCMVIRRPNGCLLTAIKTGYPPGAYRLLTGGIHHGERIFDALIREIAEETSLAIVVRRLLAVVDYRRADDDQSVFFTVAFLVDEVGGTLACNDASEHHAAFWEMAVDQLPAQADLIEHVSADFGSSDREAWAAWGHFRAISHRLVWTALSSPVAPT